jgi:hypothetical protein
MRIIIVLALLHVFGLNMYSQDQQKALDSFNQIVNKFSDFFSTPQKLIYKQTFSKSSTGVIVEIMEFKGLNLSYDIIKTESIVSPFNSYIEIDFTNKTNAACGNVFYIIEEYKTFVGWDTENGALENVDDLKCYEPQIDIFGKPRPSFVDKVRFEFAYQNNKWVFIMVNRTKYNKPNLPISGALGLFPDPVIPLTDKESMEFNAKWLALIN